MCVATGMLTVKHTSLYVYNGIERKQK
jgi:hypothetical protein